MRELVAHGGAGVAIVGSGVGQRAKQRGLQHSCGKIDVVSLRIVIRIDGGRRHVPLLAIHRLADFREPAVKLEPGRAFRVSNFVSAHDLQRTVVAPGVGITDLVRNRTQLRERLLLGRRSHPGQSLDLALHGRFDLLHNFQRCLFRLRTEVPRYIRLAQRFSQVVVDVIGAALPAGRKFLLSAQSLAVEIKVFFHECRGQAQGRIVRRMPAQIGLPV